MMDDLRARFLPRFLSTARERLARARTSLEADGTGGGLAGELHALAGEASILGLSRVSELARRGENTARGRVEPPGGDALADCRTVLELLDQEIDRLAGEVT